MKQILSLALFATLFTGFAASAQKTPEDKSKRPSPPATATATVKGTTITINYSIPSVKGRTIGKDLEPMEGKVWRTGANEATTFEVSKDVTINGSKLAAGKYSFFTIYNGNVCTLIFNKTADQWGAYDYKEADDALRVKAAVTKTTTVAEKFNISVDQAGKVTILWGNTSVGFKVQP